MTQLTEKHGLSRQAAGNVLLGNAPLEKVLLRKRAQHNLAKDRNRSCLQDAFEAGEEILIRCIRNPSLHGQVLHVSQYGFTFKNTQGIDEGRPVSCLKVRAKYAYPPSFDETVLTHRTVDEDLQAQGLRVPKSVVERRTRSSETLQSWMELGTPLSVSTHDGDMFHGSLSWWGEWELGLDLGQGLVVTFFRHAIHSLTPVAALPLRSPRASAPAPARSRPTPQREIKRLSPEEYYEAHPWLQEIDDKTILSGIELMKVLHPHREEAQPHCRKGQSPFSFLVKVLHAAGRVPSSRASSLAVECGAAEYALVKREMISEEIERSLREVPGEKLLAGRHIRPLKKGIERSRFVQLRNPAKTINEAYFGQVFRYAMAFFGEDLVNSLLGDQKAQARDSAAQARILELQKRRDQALRLADELEAEIKNLMG